MVFHVSIHFLTSAHDFGICSHVAACSLACQPIIWFRMRWTCVNLLEQQHPRSVSVSLNFLKMVKYMILEFYANEVIFLRFSATFTLDSVIVLLVSVVSSHLYCIALNFTWTCKVNKQRNCIELHRKNDLCSVRRAVTILLRQWDGKWKPCRTNSKIHTATATERRCNWNEAHFCDCGWKGRTSALHIIIMCVWLISILIQKRTHSASISFAKFIGYWNRISSISLHVSLLLLNTISIIIHGLLLFVCLRLMFCWFSWHFSLLLHIHSDILMTS